MVQAKQLIDDHPEGPLTPYRKKASFDWKKLKIALEGEENIQFKVGLTDFFMIGNKLDSL